MVNNNNVKEKEQIDKHWENNDIIYFLDYNEDIFFEVESAIKEYNKLNFLSKKEFLRILKEGYSMEENTIAEKAFFKLNRSSFQITRYYKIILNKEEFYEKVDDDFTFSSILMAGVFCPTLEVMDKILLSKQDKKYEDKEKYKDNIELYNLLKTL